MDTRERLCLFCTNFHWEEGSEYWSTLTPGWNAKIECNKHVWESDLNVHNTESFRNLMLTAATCKHYHCVAWEKKDETKTKP